MSNHHVATKIYYLILLKVAEYGSEAPETTGGKPLPRVGHRISRTNSKLYR